MRNKSSFDIVKTDLCLKHSNVTIDIKDLDDDRRCVIFNIETDYIAALVSGIRSLPSASLCLLVALVADHKRALSSVKVFGAYNCELEYAHGTLNGVPLLSFGSNEVLLGLLKLRVVHQYVLFDLSLALDQLVFGFHILLRKFI